MNNPSKVLFNKITWQVNQSVLYLKSDFENLIDYQVISTGYYCMIAAYSLHRA